MKRNIFKFSAFMLAMVVSVVAFALGAPAMATPETLLNVNGDELILLGGFGGLIVNAANLNIVFQAFKTAFNKAFKGSESHWQKIATLVPSTTSEEKYGWLGQFPRLREWIGDRHVKNLELYDYSIKNKKFESTISVPKDKIDDDSYGVFTPLIESMGDAAQTHPDELIFALLEAGFTTTCYDGQFFFDTDHPVGDGSVSNMQAGAGNAWFLLDTSRPLKPLIFQKRREYDFKSMTDPHDEHVWKRDEFQFGVDARANVGFGFWQMAFGSQDILDQTNFDLAMAAVMGNKSDEGAPLGTSANLLVCGSSNRSAAKAVVEKEYLANGESNTNYKAVEVLIVPWLP